jgi:hypothetical protein
MTASCELKPLELEGSFCTTEGLNDSYKKLFSHAGSWYNNDQLVKTDNNEVFALAHRSVICQIK